MSLSSLEADVGLCGFLKCSSSERLRRTYRKKTSLFLEGEHVLFTAAYVALSSVQGYLVLIFWGVLLGFFSVRPEVS